MASPVQPPYVLFADDDLLIRDTLSIFFEQLGWKFDVETDGGRALEAARSRSYDVIITDLSIPGIAGIDLLRAIRKEKPSQAVIVVTGAPSVENVISLLREGAVDYIQKPFDFRVLEESVNRVVECLRKEKRACEMMRFLCEETMTFEAKTSELSSNSVPLIILDKLYDCGIIDLDTKLRISLAVQEAVANALEHGNLELESKWRDEFNSLGIDKYSEIKQQRLKDPKFADRTIKIRITFKDQLLTINIKDQGPGFRAPKKSDLDPTSTKLHGRGLAIMGINMDSVYYNEDGTEVTLTKKLPFPQELKEEKGSC